MGLFDMIFDTVCSCLSCDTAGHGKGIRCLAVYMYKILPMYTLFKEGLILNYCASCPLKPKHLFERHVIADTKHWVLSHQPSIRLLPASNATQLQKEGSSSIGKVLAPMIFFTVSLTFFHFSSKTKIKKSQLWLKFTRHWSLWFTPLKKWNPLRFGYQNLAYVGAWTDYRLNSW